MKFKRERLMMLRLMFFLVLLSPSILRSQVQLAEVLSVQHSCLKGGGLIEMGLLTDPNIVNYWWSNGENSLIIDELDAGFYYFYIETIYGCLEEHEIEIELIDECRLAYDIRYYHPYENSKCVADIDLIVYDGNDEVLPETSLIIEWEDDYLDGANVTVGQSGDYCVKVSLGEDQSCCSMEACINIDMESNCRYIPVTPIGDIIVNEFGEVKKEGKSSFQYAELLVLGNGECGGVADLRGYIVDDNNGDIIVGNRFINEHNAANIGIDNGYLSFSDDVTWENVRNGSLIVLYPNSEDIPEDFPVLDPTDSNGDGIYVVAVSNADYFNANLSNWDAQENKALYEGPATIPHWDLIKISSPSDGIQVRTPEGEFVHGISAGSSAFALSDVFPLWNNALFSTDNCNCKLDGTDYWDIEHFVCQNEDDLEKSPGASNSDSNASLLSALYDCGGLGRSQSEEQQANTVAVSKNTDKEFRISPNPFNSDVIVEFYSTVPNSFDLNIYTMTGQLLHKEKLLGEKGWNKVMLSNEFIHESGIVIFELSDAEGYRAQSMAVFIK